MDELNLINKVDLRIALASTDAQLEQSLKSYLAPLLLKLGSPHAESRQAVLKVIQNIVPRITAARQIQLPVDALVAQVKAPKVLDPSLVRLYCLLFVAKGIDRMDQDHRQRVVPEILDGISSYPRSVAARVFNIFTRLLPSSLSLSLSPADEEFVAAHIAKFFLLRPNANPAPVQSPGLSVADASFFTADAGIVYKTSGEIATVKLKLFEFVKRCGFSSANLALALIVASTDDASALSDPAEALLRKSQSQIDPNEPKLVNSLISLLLGDGFPPAKPQLQDKALNFLLKGDAIYSDARVGEIASVGLNSEYNRLKHTTVNFIKSVSKNSTSFSTDMVSQLKNSILGEGWPQLQNASGPRAQKYEALAAILRSSPDLFDFSYIDFLFRSLQGESPDLRSTIQECLSSLTVHVSRLSGSDKNQLKKLTQEFLYSDDAHCSFIAIKYINCAFPFDDFEARFLCILASSKNQRADTIEEASKGLHPHWFNLLQSSNTLEFKSTKELLGGASSVTFPSFANMVTVIEANKDRLPSTEKAVEFTYQTLVMHAIEGHTTVIASDEEWLVRLDRAVEYDATVRDLLKKQIAAADTDVVKFLSLVFDSVTRGAKVLTTFLLVLSLAPSLVVAELGVISPKIIDLLGTTLHQETASDLSRAFGIIASHPQNSDEEVVRVLELLAKNETQSSNFLLAASFLLARLAFRSRDVGKDLYTSHFRAVQKASQVPKLKDTAVECLGQLAVYGVLQGEEVKTSRVFLAPLVKRCDEKAVLALAELPEDDESNTDDLPADLLSIYNTHVSKQVEYLFVSGEALLIYAGSWDSGVLKRSIDVQDVQLTRTTTHPERVAVVLNMVLESCAHTKPSLRKAGCIWLLSLVQYLGHRSEVKEKAREIHRAFMGFLADRDELVQESASTGLGLVYEMGDADLKETLVKGLVKSFSASSSSMSVEGDTELFDKDVLRTGEGSVSTYKDVLGLAADVGDPSLVYKLMSMAKSSALWSSRKGLAFGLSSILAKASVDDMFSTSNLGSRLIPKLYRYKFDPSTLVSESMNGIWLAVVQDSAKTVEVHFEAILKELLDGMGSREWRVRQASTTALLDLLQIVPLQKYESRIEELWTMSFRVLDDIKESVRKEGEKLAKALASILTRNADVKKVSVEKAESVLEKLIPFLLGYKGLLSDAEEIRTFSLETVLNLCKIGGAAVRSYIPLLLETFIGLMSTLEPEVVNYLVLNADKYNLSNSDIDAKRLQSLGHSPMMDAIEKLLELVDDELMPEVIRVVVTSIKKSVGLPSKVCGSRVVVNLSKNYSVRPYGDRLFKACQSQLSDHNETVASSYAAAAGYLCRICSVDTVVEYSKTVRGMYFDSENDRSKLLAAVASESVSKYAGDKFEAVASAFLPLAYIGKHDVSSDVAQVFERVWVENTAGNSAAKLYAVEIASFSSYLSLSSYNVRQVVARSIADLCLAMDAVESEKLNSELFTQLLEACKGKSWSGKELVLEALVSFSIKSESYVNQDQSLHESINKTVKMEAKRRNREYQKHAVKLLGKYVKVFHDEDLLDSYTSIMETILSDDYYDDDDMDIDSEQSKEEERLSFIKNVFETVSPKNVEILLPLALSSIVSLFQTGTIDVNWRSKVECNENFKILLENMDLASDDQISLLMQAWHELYKNCLSKTNIERVKVETVRTAGKLIKLLDHTNAVSNSKVIAGQLKIFLNVETSTIIRNEVDLALQ